MKARGLTVSIETAQVFEPFLYPARYKGSRGGRGTGKSHNFADLLIRDHLMERGLPSVCLRQVQQTLQHSSKRLIEVKLRERGIGEAQGFKIWKDHIETPGDGLITFQGMQDASAESIKSLEGFKRAWIEEAQTFTSHSLEMLKPTLRASGSEIWASWNPRKKTDAIDVMFCGPEIPTGAVVVTSNWRDNPWFTAELEQERLDCLRMQPDQYDHIWEGAYVTVQAGSYFAKELAQAKAEDRICRVAADPLMTFRAYWDIGGTGARADACAIWIVQFVGTEVHVLDYYESIGQPLAAHVAWLRSSGYGTAQCVLPHDGAQHDKVYATSYESALREAGFDVRIIPNMGAGAATARVEAIRRMFPSVYFNADKTEAGRDALGWYHERRDVHRNMGLGPEHDWSSHAADAFGLCAVDKPTQGRKVAFKPITFRSEFA